MYEIPGLDPHQNLPYDNLHCVLLGYVQMLWTEMVKDSRVKPDVEDLDLRTAAASREGGIQSMVGGKRITNWSRSLQGGNFGSIIQLWPSNLLSFYESKGRLSEMQDLIHLWSTSAKLTKLLYATNLMDVDAWSEEVQQTYEEMICNWADMWGLDYIRSKVKLHLLCHVVMWVRRFGPIIGAQCKTHECTNKHLRGNGEHTNRQAYSLDIAGRYSIFSGALHLAAGG
ncbi:hypothetical protein K470DRAFT_278219 [Piedraia hortae CBS 480.64]|uniref:Uncharacterized protein n=1 Tax=Piedraia hortae CBS 480.64 TaxID=1314780 RepID=A0A6A7BUM6_9PEZI|nr:hypothetical protein K470DRAFT_278219 [Piedraia hortae CBS 480.64]